MVFLCFLLSATACVPLGLEKGVVGDPRGYNKLGILGPIPLIKDKKGSGLVRDPIDGSYHYGEYVEPDYGKVVWNTFLDELRKRYKGDILAVEQMESAMLVETSKAVSEDPRSLIAKAGGSLGLDGVVVIYLYRWKERRGSDFAVSSPASVGFGVHLIRPGKEKDVISFVYDETQTSLSENLLKIKELAGGGFKWVQASYLASKGMEKAMDKIFGPVLKGE